MWTPAFSLDELAPGEARLLKTDTHRVAVFRTETGDVFAVDNACPHEGYPLVQGEVRGQVLTCAWHNYKFSLGSGACLKGDEDVRAYATRVVDNRIEVELTEPDRSTTIAKARASLEAGMVDAEPGRMAREAVRLLQAGMSATDLLVEGAMLDARYAEYGTSHALPVAVDLVEYLNGDTEHDTAVILTLLELVSDECQRRPPHEWPQPQDHEQSLAQAIEDEQPDLAIAIVRGAIRTKGHKHVALALIDNASQHFLGFGHGLIYATKVHDLLEHNHEYADDLLSALTLRIISGTREDNLPPMARFKSWVTTHKDQLRRGQTNLPEDELDQLAVRIVDPKDKQIEGEFLQLILDGIDPEQLVDVLVHAAALRLLRFDPAIHDDHTVQDGWLSVTHPLTFAHAIRDALRASASEAPLINLVWSLAFTRRGHRLDQDDHETPDPVPAGTNDLIKALDKRDPKIASLASGWDGDPAELARRLQEWILGGPATLPIYIAHQIKTTRVALQEQRNRVPMMATLRYLASPVAERSTRSVVHDAVRLVIHGNLPRLRAS